MSVSKDRTCRISDALSGTVLKVFTASVALTSVFVGPCDAVVACGGANGSISFFKQLDNSILGEEVLSVSSGGKKSRSGGGGGSSTKAVPMKNIMKEIGCDVFDLAVSNATTNNSNNNNNSTNGSNAHTNTDICKVVGPFTGGPQSPIIFLGDLFLQQQQHRSGNNNAEDDDSSSSFVSSLGQISSPHENPHLVVVSRDGFVQTYSWTSLAFVKDISILKKGVVAACIVPPKYMKFATSTIADKPLIQKSALQLKKAPVSSAGARIFLMKSLWSVSSAAGGSNKNIQQQQKVDEDVPQPESAPLFYRIRQRDDVCDEEEQILARNAAFLRKIEFAVMKEKEEELLLRANELFASSNNEE